MSNNVDKMRRDLLEETNYRCGYCMRNITLRVYYLDNDPDKKPIHDYAYYNIFDRCHIEPNALVQDHFKDFYNLIALCKICHKEIDGAKMLNEKELKRLKLHWLIASGRFNSIEIKLLFQLYSNDKRKLWVQDDPLNDSKASLVVSNAFMFQGIVDACFVKQRVINACSLLLGDSETWHSNPNAALSLDENGIIFCEKFKDVHEEI